MSIRVKIYESETVREIAEKIWEGLDVMASCTVFGFVEDCNRLIPKGEAVLIVLKELDDKENIKKIGTTGKRQRIFKYRNNSIGGPIAHKIFTWEKRIVDSDVRYTIWRYQ